ncbi:MAG: sugar transferase [Sphingomonas sp.]|nr:sugar transferase [Sphingomonas sp.]
MKRLIDILVSALTLILLSPLLLVVGIANLFVHGSPVFFRQVRPGKDAKPFELVKFRTMRNAAGPDGKPLSDAQRLTRFGKFLRSTSIDELPGLWNVLKGDMSLVGPRPLLMDYVPLYSEEQARRMEVRPGLTGWAQVNGRNALSWEEKFAHDVWYVDHQSILLDFKIMVMTAFKVLGRSGISAEGDATMPRFTGSKND